ncbi:MAG: stage III sporulation protein AE, partial [Firmicutes bacterium]|nr:stage III sporulation protein AE [Bacillota bacterium]
GEDGTEFSSIFSYLINLFLGDLGKILPFMLMILGVCVAFSIINSAKSGFASESVGNIIKFACVAVIAVVLFAQVFALISSVSKAVNSMSAQINAVFPVILTLMTASGATGSAAAYTPAVAILGNVLTGIITMLALPCVILAVVFDIVGNLSDAVKLKKMSGFFMSALKWVLGTAFFVFLAFLSVKGITASVRDGVSIRSAKFAISSYVPIIGGYLSEGFNMVMAGSVVIKNAVGLGGLTLLLLTLAPTIVNIIVFSLSLTLLGAVVEPLGLDGVSGILTGIGKTLKSLTAIVLGMAFLYFVFLLLTICTGNLVL